MDLIRGSNLPLEQGHSQMRECTRLCGSAGEVLALHDAVIGGWTAKGEPIAFIVSAHPCEIRAASYFPLEVINVRWFLIGACRLVVAPVLVEPGYRERIGAAIVDKLLTLSERT